MDKELTTNYLETYLIIMIICFFIIFILNVYSC